MRGPALALVLLALAAPAARAEEPERLIERLGSPSFKERTAAHARLVALGERALPALRAAMRAERGPEVALRVQDAYWRILVTDRLATLAEKPRQDLVAALVQGGEPREAAIANLLYRSRVEAMRLALELPLVGEGRHLLDWDAFREVPEAVQLALLDRLWPVLETSVNELQYWHLARAARASPATAARLFGAVLARGGHARQEALLGLVRLGTEDAWRELRRAVVTPGLHRLWLGSALDPIEGRWPLRVHELFPGILAEVVQHARDPSDSRLQDCLRTLSKYRIPGCPAPLSPPRRAEIRRPTWTAPRESPGVLLARLRELEPSVDWARARPLLEAFRGIHHPPAVPAIRPYLEVADDDVQVAALGALFAQRVPLDEAWLARHIAGPASRTRDRALRVLDLRPSPALGRALLDHLLAHGRGNIDHRTRDLVVRALGPRAVLEVAERLLAGHWPDGPDGERNREAHRPWLGWLFERHWRQQADELRALLTRHRRHPRHGALVEKFLAVLGPRATDAGLAWLADPQRRNDGLWVLAEVPEERALAPLLALLEKSEPDDAVYVSRVMEAILLGPLDGPYQQLLSGSQAELAAWWRRWVSVQPPSIRRIRCLQAMLHGDSVHDREMATVMAGRLRDPALVPDLLALLDPDRDANRRLLAAVLAGFEDGRITGALQSLLHDGDPVVAEEAAFSLVERRDPWAVSLAARRLERLREDPRGDLPRAHELARFLVRAGYRAGGESLLRWAQGEPGYWRNEARSALCALAGIPDPGRHPAPEEELELRSHIEAWWAENAPRLGPVPAPPARSAEELLERLASAPLPERGELVEELSRAPSLPRGIASRLLHGPDRQARDAVAEVLRRRKETWAAAELESALASGAPAAWDQEREWVEWHGHRPLPSPYRRDPENHAALGALGCHRDPLAEALLATAGRAAVAPLVRAARRRATAHRLYLLLRFRALFGAGPVDGLPRDVSQVVPHLDAWARWGEAGSAPRAAVEAVVAREDHEAWIDYSVAVQELGLAAHWARRLLGQGEPYAGGWRALAELAAAASRWPEATAAWGRYLERRSDARGHLGCAEALMACGDWKAAIYHLTFAHEISRTPEKRTRALAWRGRCHEELGEHDLAERDYQAWEATRNDPDESRQARVRLAWGRGRHEQVLDLTASVEPRRGDPDLQIWRARALVRSGRAREAEPLLWAVERRGATHDPDPDEDALGARLDLAWACYRAAQGELELARIHLARAVQGGAITAEEAARLPELAALKGR